MINVQHLTKRYQHLIAVDDVSFRVEGGETLVLLGTSGSGKTTTLRMLNRLVEPTAGSIHINGADILEQRPEALRRNIGYVLQGYGLFPHYTVAENIAVVPRLFKWSPRKIRERVDVLLTKLQLPPEQYRHLYPTTLSGGQKQRVGLARALAANPPILLMDEPFGALDPLTRQAVQKELKELDELKNKTTILVTHDVQEAFRLGDKIGLMDGGKLLQVATPADLLFHPANEFVKQFFDHQRLQLEWQAVTLKDLWHYLPAETAPRTTHLTSSQTVWEAVTALTAAQKDLIAFDTGTATARSVSVALLQLAIQKQKQPA